MPAPIHPRDRLIVALDLPSVREAAAMVDVLGEDVSFVKVGLELACAGGLSFAAQLAEAGKDVFLDLKLHDIPNTVERAAARVAATGVRFLTVHAYPQTMAAAARGARGSALTILAVTVLTSYDDKDVFEAGYSMNAQTLVGHRSAQAKAAGIGGIVLSPEEVTATRAVVGPDMLLVTPGIRPVGSASGDQKRVTTPGEAIAAGADYLVVGRPITGAADPRTMARSIIADIAAR